MAMLESSGSLAREGIDLDEDSQIFHHHHHQQQQQQQQQQHPQQHPQPNLLLQLRHQHQQQKNYIFSHHLIDQHLQFGSRDGDRDRDSDRDGDGGGYGHSEENLKLNGSGNGNEIDNQKQNQKNFDSTCNLRELEDLLSKLNPLAEEFFPPSSASFSSRSLNEEGSQANTKGGGRSRKKGNGPAPGKKRVSLRSSRAQQDDSIKRTVYVSDIDHQVTEEQLAALFITCGQVVDCRVCGDPNSVLRFAFVEFTDEEGARAALSLSGTMLGFYPVRVLPSKTAIVPVNPTFLPRSEDELEMCARTVYCANIDKKVSQTDVKLFFEMLCGEVARIRLLGDFHHSTRIAFVEFVMAESAIRALNCSGAILGSLPVRVSPSKTPVRPRSPRLL